MNKGKVENVFDSDEEHFDVELYFETEYLTLTIVFLKFQRWSPKLNNYFILNFFIILKIILNLRIVF